MYACAQRVVDSSGQESGLNVLVYEHGSAETGQIDWNKPDIRAISEDCPGTLVAEKIEVAPGGNSVVSYLDVAMRDGVEVATVEIALWQIEKAVRLGGEIPIRNLHAGVAVEFYVAARLTDVAGDEFVELRDVLLAQLQDRSAPAWKEKGPIVIWVRNTAEGQTFELDVSSVGVVDQLQSRPWKSARVSIAHEVQYDFEQLYGNVVRYVVPLIVNVPLTTILKHTGGIEVRQRESNETVYRWPVAS